MYSTATTALKCTGPPVGPSSYAATLPFFNAFFFPPPLGPTHELGAFKKRKKRTKKTREQKRGKKTVKKQGGGRFLGPSTSP